MKNYKVMIPFILLIVMALSACNMPAAAAVPTSAATKPDFNATALVQTIQALSTQNELTSPMAIIDVTDTPQLIMETGTPAASLTPVPSLTPTATPTPLVTSTSTRTPTQEPTAAQAGIPVVYITPVATYYPNTNYSYNNSYPSYRYPTYRFPPNRRYRGAPWQYGPHRR